MSMKPILFNTDMVRAIQNGTKTVTRRVVKSRKCDGLLEMVGGTLCETIPKKPPFNWGYVPCEPSYRPGDILYVRETWGYYSRTYGTLPKLYYKADGDAPDKIKWHPSIHMPREAARIFLRVTDVWVQQLRDVTEEDARAEGFGSRAEFIAAILKMYPDCTEESWMWVIEFKRISREEAMKNA